MGVTLDLFAPRPKPAVPAWLRVPTGTVLRVSTDHPAGPTLFDVQATRVTLEGADLIMRRFAFKAGCPAGVLLAVQGRLWWVSEGYLPAVQAALDIGQPIDTWADKVSSVAEVDA